MGLFEMLQDGVESPKAERLTAEGHQVGQRGKKLVFEDFERALVQLD